MKIGIITAMASERGQIEKLLSGLHAVHGAGPSAGPGGPSALASRVYRIGASHGNEVILAESGIGKVNAALGALELIRGFRPDCIVSTGVAGGVGASLSVGDVVAAREVVYHDVDCGAGNAYGQVQGLPARFPCDERLYSRALSLRTGARVLGGLICSGDQFVSGRERLDAIKARFPDALAVEMESGAIAQTCYLCGVPFISFRVISDTPGRVGPEGHSSAYENFWRVMAEKSFSVTEAFLESLPTSPGGN